MEATTMMMSGRATGSGAAPGSTVGATARRRDARPRKTGKPNPYNFAKYRRTIRREAQREFAWRQSLKDKETAESHEKELAAARAREQPSQCRCWRTR